MTPFALSSVGRVIWFWISHSLSCCAYAALVNTTIDEQDPGWSYSPRASWDLHTGLDFGYDYQGTHMLTEDPNAFATITRTFTSFYWVSAKWPYKVTTNVAVDGGKPVTIDMQDYSSPNVGSGPSSVRAAVLWPYKGTVNAQHTIRVSVVPGDPYGIVDAIIFEADDPTASSMASSSSIYSVSATTSSSSTKASRTAADNSNAGTPHTSHHIALIAGIIAAVVALMLLFLFWWFCVRRKNQRDSVSVNFGAPTNTVTDPHPASYYGDGFDGPARSTAPVMTEPGMDPLTWPVASQTPYDPYRQGVFDVSQRAPASLESGQALAPPRPPREFYSGGDGLASSQNSFTGMTRAQRMYSSASSPQDVASKNPYHAQPSKGATGGPPAYYPSRSQDGLGER